MAVVDLTLSEVFEDAFEQAGVPFETGYDIKVARRALTQTLNEWQNRGLNFWTVEDATISCVADTAQYSLPADTIDVLELSIRSTDGLTDYTARRLDVSAYSQLSKKQQDGRPTTYMVERLTAPLLNLWPVPDAAYTVVYWRLRRMESISSGVSGSPDMPSRCIPALTAAMAVRIARVKNTRQNIPDLLLESERQFQLMSNMDRQRDSYYIRPAVAR